jgi:hypothetical protein
MSYELSCYYLKINTFVLHLQHFLLLIPVLLFLLAAIVCALVFKTWVRESHFFDCQHWRIMHDSFGCIGQPWQPLLHQTWKISFKFLTITFPYNRICLTWNMQWLHGIVYICSVLRLSLIRFSTDKCSNGLTTNGMTQLTMQSYIYKYIKITDSCLLKATYTVCFRMKCEDVLGKWELIKDVSNDADWNSLNIKFSALWSNVAY